MAPLIQRRIFRVISLVAVGVSAAFFAGCGGSGERFPVAEFLNSPDNLQGNRYELEAEVDSALNYREGVGRIVAVRPLKSNARLPVFIADSLKANLLVAQRYRFTITVRKGGLLYVDELKKL